MLVEFYPSVVLSRIYRILLLMFLRLSIKCGFGGWGHGFSGCDRLGRLGEFDGFREFSRFNGFSGIGGFSGLGGFDGLGGFGRFG